MGIQNCSEDIILVDLPAEPQMIEELKEVIDIFHDQGNCDVVLDFSNVGTVTSSSLTKLLQLRKLAADCGHRVVFCNVAPVTRGTLTLTGLDGVFELAEDKLGALASLQTVS